MLQYKLISKVLFSLFAMISLSSLGALECPKTASKSHQKHMTKKYISSDSIIFEDGQMLIMDGNTLLRVKTLHQDDNGIFIPVAGPYGYCPNGHSYGMDGGCMGHNCPYN